MLALLAAAALAAEPLTDGVEGHASDPVWAPDGSAIVVNVGRHDAEADLWLVPLDGEPRRVQLPGASNPFSGARPVAMNPVWRGPRSFLFEGTDPAGRFRLYEARGAEVVAIDTPRSGHVTFPSLAEDGTIAYVADDTGHGDVYLLRPDGAERRLTDSPVPEMFPQLALDGATVVYSRKVVATEDLYERDLASGVERPLAGGAGDQTRPVRAGGAVLFFDGSRGAGRWDLVAVDGDGARRVLARDVALPVRARPAVSPDGRFAAYTAAGEPARLGLVAVDGSWRAEVPTSQVAVGEPALGLRGDRVWLAWTGLPSAGSSWRRLFAEDVTDRIGGGEARK